MLIIKRKNYFGISGSNSSELFYALTYLKVPCSITVHDNPSAHLREGHPESITVKFPNLPGRFVRGGLGHMAVFEEEMPFHSSSFTVARIQSSLFVKFFDETRGKPGISFNIPMAELAELALLGVGTPEIKVEL